MNPRRIFAAAVVMGIAFGNSLRVQRRPRCSRTRSAATGSGWVARLCAARLSGVPADNTSQPTPQCRGRRSASSAQAEDGPELRSRSRSRLSPSQRPPMAIDGALLWIRDGGRSPFGRPSNGGRRPRVGYSRITTCSCSSTPPSTASRTTLTATPHSTHATGSCRSDRAQPWAATLAAEVALRAARKELAQEAVRRSRSRRRACW